MFGGHAPIAVVAFLQKNASLLAMHERFSVLLAALNIYTSAPHHAKIAESEYRREDADLALAITAALVKLAPLRGCRELNDGGISSIAEETGSG